MVSVVGVATVAALFVWRDLKDWRDAIEVFLLPGGLVASGLPDWSVRVTRLDRPNNWLGAHPDWRYRLAAASLVLVGAAGGAGATSLALTNQLNYSGPHWIFWSAACFAWATLIVLTCVIAGAKVSWRQRPKKWSTLLGHVTSGLGVVALAANIVIRVV